MESPGDDRAARTDADDESFREMVELPPSVDDRSAADSNGTFNAADAVEPAGVSARWAPSCPPLLDVLNNNDASRSALPLDTCTMLGLSAV